MGELYGNITTLNRTHFLFDKIYSSRYEMELNLNKDDIFAGRFVLVLYTLNLFSEGDILQGYLNPNDETDTKIYIDSECLLPLIYVQMSSNKVLNPVAANWNQYFWKYSDTGQYKFYFHLPSIDYFNTNLDYYTISNGPEDLTKISQFITDGQIVKTVKYILVIDSNNNNNDSNNYYAVIKYYTCIGGATTGDRTPTFLEVTNITDNAYFINYLLDKRYYALDSNYGPNARGYDGTVWQKIYSGGEGRYILIAYLNAMIPLFLLVADPPSSNPRAPYIDTQSADAFYRLHVPSHLGFLIKEAESETTEQGIMYPYSDLTILQDYLTYSTASNEVINTEHRLINADIYFNKKASDYLFNYKDTSTINEINITPTGKSGKYYYNDLGEKVLLDDMYELSIHLPMIGNMISDGYDLIYGDTTNEINLRATDINWYNAADSDLLKTTGNSLLGGKTYNLNTLAGSLNTIHNIMGLIVQPLSLPPNEVQLNDLNDKYLYSYNNQLYRKGLINNKTIIDNSGFSFNISTVTEDDFVDNKYYIREGTNYTPATAYATNVNYYLRNVNTVRYTPILLSNFSLNNYYLQEGENYILDNNTYPSYLDRTYFTITVNSERYFTGLYTIGSLYINNNGNYELSYDTVPKLDTDYYGINPTLLYTETYFYHPGSYYYKVNDAFYLDTNPRITSGRTYYILTFESEPQYGFNVEGEVIQYYRVKHSEKVNYLSDPPNNDLFTKYENTFIPYENIKDLPTIENRDPYTLPRTFYRLAITTYSSGTLYLPGVYYVKNGDNYIKSYDSLNTTTIYYLLNINQINSKFYIPDKYYYNTNGSYQLSTGSFVSNRLYYEKASVYVEHDTTGLCPYGYEWSDYASYVPPSISLFTVEKVPGLISITGVGENTDTLYGLLLQLNKMYAPNEEETRDITSIRGIYNTLRDILYLIKTLRPGYILYVNDFGLIESMSLSKLKLLLNNV